MRPLRLAVLRPGGESAQVVWPGDDGADTVHLAAHTEQGAVVGVATLLRQADPAGPADQTDQADQADPTLPAWRLRGMATAPAARGTGVGLRVLAAVIGQVATAGGGLLWCNARLGAVAFYRRAGFTSYGETWEEPGIGPHVRMRRLVAPAGPPSTQRLGQVGQEIGGRLDADREPHQPGVDGQR